MGETAYSGKTSDMGRNCCSHADRRDRFLCIQYFVEIFRTYCRQNPSYSVEGGTIVPMDLEELYDKVYRYCYMKLRHPQAAEDMTQEAFLRFLRVYEEREIKKRTAYLYTIARNLCTDFCRARRAVPLEQAEQIPSEDRDERHTVRIALEQALDRLPAGERILFYRKYYYRQSTAQIARETGLTERAVEGRLYRLRMRLRDSLGGERDG